MRTEDELRALPAPPVDDPWDAGAWIALHHPWGGNLMNRVNAIDAESGLPDVDSLAETIDHHAEYSNLWATYQDQKPPPDDDDEEYDRWQEEGPQASSEVRSFGVLSTSEKECLRVLAVLGQSGSRISFGLFDTGENNPGRSWPRS